MPNDGKFADNADTCRNEEQTQVAKNAVGHAGKAAGFGLRILPCQMSQTASAIMPITGPGTDTCKALRNNSPKSSAARRMKTAANMANLPAAE